MVKKTFMKNDRRLFPHELQGQSFHNKDWDKDSHSCSVSHTSKTGQATSTSDGSRLK